MEILYTKTAAKAISSMDSKLKSRIRSGILGLTRTPPEGDIKKMAGYEDVYRLRIGSYRVVFRYDRNNIPVLLVIMNVGSRGDIYKK